ncbi:hypothetical protein F8388_001168 [Cannabis sativa]|uniref:Uncharacterized protein n=1 Tax=Cannabis sativa TaxID=3483 RepID=A0A7J6EU95_CANSA|nr:hypothetical protein F8388_001168 [Cannabis sativa]KAF4377030.1 hypothetical protein G4B88_023816 [Cannabis sativa]
MDSSTCSSAPDPEMWIIQGTLAWRTSPVRTGVRSNVDPTFYSLDFFKNKKEESHDLRAKGQSQASQKVTEACKGFLGPVGDCPSSAKAEGSLTARPTRPAGTKVGLSDPTVPSGRAFSIVANILLRIIPTTSGEKEAFAYYRDGAI